MPDETGDKGFLSKHLVHDVPKIVRLVVIDANENHSIFAQQASG